MGTDVLAYNALARSIDGIRDQIAEKRRLRDSAIAAIPAIDSAVTYTCGLIDSLGLCWQAKIDSADSFIANNTQQVIGGYDNECWHTKFQSACQCSCGWQGIKLLCNCSGSVTCDICVWNCNGSHWQCGASCSICVPAGASKIMFSVQAPGGPSLMSNCCGGAAFGPMGGYIQTTFCVSEGDTFQVCAGCSYCCFPYCCGYTLYRSENSFVNGCIGGVTGCMVACSPHPHACCEQKTRQCYGQRLNDGALPQAFGGCYTIYHHAHCMCGSEGNSICNNSYGQCCYFCYGPGSSYSPTSEAETIAATDHQPVHQEPPTANGSLNNIDNIVPGSCFRVFGMYHGSYNSDNCWWVCTYGSPWATAHSGCTYVCCRCMNQCCPGCIWSANQGYGCFPGHGGWASMACGGATIYSDMGRHGAVRVQWC